MTENKVQVTIVTNESNIVKRINKLFVADNTINIQREKNYKSLQKSLKENQADVILLFDDLIKDTKNVSSSEFVSRISRVSPDSQILFFAHPKNIKRAISSLTSGTYQYVKQPVNDDELKVLIQTAMRDKEAEEKEIQQIIGSGDRFGEIIGRSPQMQKVYKQIKRASKSDIPVLILGETGTGKDLTAQVIHRKSNRSGKPFVTINLGSLPTDLVASELFGHEKGAFSGAIKQHKGIFERAGKGTVFLDEIDCIDEKVRVSLLRLLDQKSFNRLGGSQSIQSGARLITATNADLEEMVAEGDFREDLFYRLDVFRITVPPLRTRIEDIPLLTQEFVNIYSLANDKKPLRISREYLEVLQAYHWPGNIRELKSVIHRSVLMCDIRELKLRHLPPRFKDVEPSPGKISFSIGTPLDEVERTMVLRALEATDNNRKEAAKLLGISRRAIYNKLKKHNIE